jgi:hypothetical protein
MLTLFVSSLTLATGRVTILQDAGRLIIFGVFPLLAAGREGGQTGSTVTMRLVYTGFRR